MYSNLKTDDLARRESWRSETRMRIKTGFDEEQTRACVHVAGFLKWQATDFFQKMNQLTCYRGRPRTDAAKALQKFYLRKARRTRGTTLLEDLL
jgi:restriction endonuclease